MGQGSIIDSGRITIVLIDICCGGGTIETSPAQRLIARLAVMGVRYGREDSFKLGHRRVLAGRVLIGISAGDLNIESALGLASTLDMPDDCLKVLLPHVAQANAVFFGFEDLAGSWVCKVYLEFWDQVRRAAVRTGARTPQLLHLGVKWDSALPGRHQVARYDCHPLLDVRSILRRMAACYADDGAPALCAAAQAIVLAAAQRTPGASLLYLEVSEQGNARTSFDINLYKSGMLVDDAAVQLQLAGAFFDLAPERIAEQLALIGQRPLGHLSSGVDRHGKPFLSVYGETVAPD